MMRWLSLTLMSLVLAGVCCPGRTLAGPADADLSGAIRRGDLSAVRAALAAGASVNAPDEFGDTPLMAAALYADAAMVRQLLQSGADVGATNHAGATALMRAATDGAMTRLLVDQGAQVNARSAMGNTALILAARPHGSERTVRFLLDRGADVRATNVLGVTALMTAVASGDGDTVRLLLDRGADVNAKPAMSGDGFILGGGRTALMWAAFRGNGNLVRLLLARGANVHDFTLAGGALAQAAWSGNAEVARLLLDAGAAVDQRDLIANYTPLHWAASSERSDDSLVRLLLARGADANAEGGQPVDGFLGVAQTPLMLARKRGETPLVQALLQGGARDVAVPDGRRAPPPVAPLTDEIGDAAVVAAIQRALPALERTAIESTATYRKHASRQQCVSCHQQHLPLSAISLAMSRDIRLPVDRTPEQVAAVSRFAGGFREADLQTTFHPEPAIGNGYALMSLQLQGKPSSAITDSMVHQITVIQAPDGHWSWNLPRPPIQSSDIGATALAVQSLKSYPLPGRREEFEQRIRRARSWMAKARPESAEERAYQLLGLAWAGDSRRTLKRISEELVREQRPDGGWAQLPGLPSDAFATGQTLYSLLLAGALPSRHPAIEGGVRFLLRTQLADGTWHVRRRAFPFQPPMESGFPHGADSWISSAATSWAVMALSSALPSTGALVAGAPLSQAEAVGVVSAAAATGVPHTIAVGASSAPVRFASDIKPLFERSCVSCHSGERPKGAYGMESREGFFKGGNRGDAAVVPGQIDRSVLLHLVTDQVVDLEMPPIGKRTAYPPLTPEEVARVQVWIAQGAEWPDGIRLVLPAKGN